MKAPHSTTTSSWLYIINLQCSLQNRRPFLLTSSRPLCLKFTVLDLFFPFFGVHGCKRNQRRKLFLSSHAEVLVLCLSSWRWHWGFFLFFIFYLLYLTIKRSSVPRGTILFTSALRRSRWESLWSPDNKRRGRFNVSRTERFQSPDKSSSAFLLHWMPNTKLLLKHQ